MQEMKSRKLQRKDENAMHKISMKKQEGYRVRKKYKGETYDILTDNITGSRFYNVG